MTLAILLFLCGSALIAGSIRSMLKNGTIAISRSGVWFL